MKKVIFNSLLILLVSCTSELPVTPDLEQGQEQEVPVQFSVTVNPIENDNSRATINEFLPENSEVGIYAIKGEIVNGNFSVTENKTEGYWWHNSNIQDNFLNAKYIASNDQYHQLLPAGATGSFPKEGALQFFAYYPYDENVSIGSKEDANGNIVPIAPKLNIVIGDNEEETQDYMYTGAVNASSKNIVTNLNFKHALGKLRIYVYTNLDLGNLEEEDYPYVNNLTITTQKSQEGTMDLATGEITPTAFRNKEFSKDFESPFDDYENSYLISQDKNSKAIYSNLFIPNAETQTYLITKLSLTITQSNNTKTYVYRSDPTKEAGSLQIPEIIIKKGQTSNLYIKYNPTTNN